MSQHVLPSEIPAPARVKPYSSFLTTGRMVFQVARYFSVSQLRGGEGKKT